MPDGTEKDVRSVVDLVLQCSDITKELVQQAMRDYLQQNQDKSTHGKTSLRKLAEQRKFRFHRSFFCKFAGFQGNCKKI